MLTICPAKEIQGNITLPPNPDLFVLCAAVTLAGRKCATISPIEHTPLWEEWFNILKQVFSISFDNNGCTLAPDCATPDMPVRLPYSILPYRDIVIMILLGQRRRVSLSGLPQARYDRWSEILKRTGCLLHAETTEEETVLRLEGRPDFSLLDERIEADVIHSLLGLALGAAAEISLITDTQFSSPLRTLLPCFGYELTVKIPDANRPADPLARRIRRLTGKNRDRAASVDFSISLTSTSTDTEDIVIDLPGDDILGSILIAAKGIVQKGNLIIENIPLEPWACQTLQFVRKMGQVPGIQQTSQGAFGSIGLLQLQRFELSGRTIDCVPIYQFSSHLPSMSVLAAFAEGKTVFRNLGDLRADLPDGIEEILECHKLLGTHLGEMPEAIILKGARQYDGFDLTRVLPPHLSGAFAVAGLRCIGTTTIADDTLRRRWPEFESLLNSLCVYRK